MKIHISLIPLLITTLVTFAIAKEDKQDVGTVIGIDLGKYLFKDLFFFLIF